MALLADLENSLRSSQAVLLSRDVVRIEELASEQFGLRHALSAYLHSLDARIYGHETAFPGARGDAVRAAQERVLHLGRVQAALLRRAQQSLLTISHLLAGPESGYGPPAGGQGIVAQRQEPYCEEA